MLSASLALSWMFWRRHRWGVLVAASYLFVAIILSALLAPRIAPRYLPGVFALIVMPSLGLAFYVLPVFTFAFDADLAVRESAFPQHLLRLPISTGLLAGWPIAAGALATVGVWLIFATFVAQPWAAALNERVPLWPALLLMAFVAWLQAIVWLPFGLPWLRALLVILMVPTVLAIVGGSLENGVPEVIISVALAILACAGWFVAGMAVRKARSGDTPNWEWLLWPLHWLITLLPRGPHTFVSAAAAQRWFESRLSGNAMTIMVVILLPFVLLPIVVGANDVLPIEQALLSVPALIVFLAGIGGWRDTANNSWVKDRFAMSPFVATTPVSSAGMAAALLQTTAVSTLLAWVFGIATACLVVWLTGRWVEATGWWRDLFAEIGTLRAVVGLSAGIALLVIWTWKRRIGSLYLMLPGRKWISLVVAQFCAMSTLGLWVLAAWVYKHPETHQATLLVLPIVLMPLILFRAALTLWALRLSLQHGLLDKSVVLCWGTCWLLAALGLIGALLWVTAGYVAPIYIVLATPSMMPMSGLAGITLTLAWNRHR